MLRSLVENWLHSQVCWLQFFCRPEVVVKLHKSKHLLEVQQRLFGGSSEGFANIMTAYICQIKELSPTRPLSLSLCLHHQLWYQVLYFENPAGIIHVFVSLVILSLLSLLRLPMALEMYGTLSMAGVHLPSSSFIASASLRA